MKIAYFDCFSGISGNMILGALLDAGLTLEDLHEEFTKLNLYGYRVRSEEVSRKGLSGILVTIEVLEAQPERHLSDIERIISVSHLDMDVKKTVIDVFRQLAEVEAAIHNCAVEDLHFHEVGALDAILDIVGAVVGMKKLGLDAVYASPIHVGRGFTTCQHGTIPLPAPATLALLEGIPVYSQGIEVELTTPTGAAIIRTLAEEFGPQPGMTVEHIGYGAGNRDLAIPNMLRVITGEQTREENGVSEEAGGSSAPEYITPPDEETDTAGHTPYDSEKAVLIETNIDDMRAEFFSYLYEILMQEGALDVFTTPIYMKKNRPAVQLSVLTTPEYRDQVLSVIFAETTTLGVRIYQPERQKLQREIVTVETRFGPVNMKIGRAGDRLLTIAPEYEDCCAIATRLGIPLKDIYREVEEAARQQIELETKPVSPDTVSL